MADIFISYKSERRPAARHLKKILDCYFQTSAEECVWYDYGLIPGHDFQSQILTEISKAKVVLVLWCRMAVKSPWVTVEAEEARQASKIIPIRIENCELPAEFAEIDTINLSEWDASPRSAMLDRLLDEVGRRLGREATARIARLRELEEDWRGYGALSLAQFALGRPLEPNAARPSSLTHDALILGAAPKAISPNLADHWENARDGNPAAIFQVAASFHLGNRGLPRNEQEAVRLYRYAADHGDPDAQLVLGFMHEDGQCGFAIDEREALRFYELAAAQGDAAAQDRLGGMHAEGRGGATQDEQLAGRLFQLAAAQGNARAQTNLAAMHVDGRGGMAKNDHEAVRLCRLAADQGFPFANTFLAVMYEAGRGGLPRDEREAVRLFRLAASAGEPTAQFYLSAMYEHGNGVLKKDSGESMRLLKLAAANGSQDARDELARRNMKW